MERLNLVWEQHFPLYACLCVLMASSLLFCGNGLKATNLKLDLSYCRLLQVNAMRTLKFITSPSALGMNSLSWGRQKSCTQRLSRRSHDSTLSSKRLGSSIRSASWEKAKCRAWFAWITGPMKALACHSSARADLAPGVPWSFRCRRANTPSATLWRKPGSPWTWLCPALHPGTRMTSTSSARAIATSLWTSRPRRWWFAVCYATTRSSPCTSLCTWLSPSLASQNTW